MFCLFQVAPKFQNFWQRLHIFLKWGVEGRAGSSEIIPHLLLVIMSCHLPHSLLLYPLILHCPTTLSPLPCPWTSLHPLYSWTTATGLRTFYTESSQQTSGEWLDFWLAGWLDKGMGRKEESGKMERSKRKKEIVLFDITWVVLANHKWPCCEAHLIS